MTAENFNQLLQVLSVLQANIPLDIFEQIPEDVIERILSSPENAGNRFAEFLKNGANLNVSVERKIIQSLPQALSLTDLDKLILKGHRLTAKIDYSQPPESLIASGKYKDAHEALSAINQNSWKVSGKWELDFQLIQAKVSAVHLGRVVDMMTDQGLEPAGFYETLAFGATYPDLQRLYSIIGPGTFHWDRYKGANVYSGVLALCCKGSARRAECRSSSCAFNRHSTRFLGIARSIRLD